MAKYIDRDRLIREGWSLQRTYQKDAYTMVLEMKKPEDLPTVDAEPVVRCRDCIRYDLAHNGIFGECRRQNATFYANDFCSYGERRGDAE